LRRSARQPRHLRDAAGARGSDERTTISEEEVARREAGDALHADREICGPVAVHVAIEQREALERLPPQLAGGGELAGADVDEGLVAAEGGWASPLFDGTSRRAVDSVCETLRYPK
jgi:hypothetical protein